MQFRFWDLKNKKFTSKKACEIIAEDFNFTVGWVIQVVMHKDIIDSCLWNEN